MADYLTSAVGIADPPTTYASVPVRFVGPASMLPDRRPPWKEFGASIIFQGLLVVVLLWVGILHPNVLTPPVHDYHAVRLVNTPPPVSHEPVPPRPLKVRPAVVFKQPDALRVPEVKPRIEHPEPVAPKIEIATKLPIQTPTLVMPKQAVKVNVFSTGSSQPPTIERPAQRVQTGGFGDPRGLSSQNNPNRPVTIARQGAFDLPSGPGYGNGTGGAKGKAGVVASSGFGDGIATGTTSTSNHAIQQGGFGDARAAAPGQIPKHAEAAEHIKPAEILSKPVPEYTDEARKLHIEGEVLLEVVFESSGSIRVIRVVHGLGHGLDEAAIKAAQQIRFNPAQKDGQPVDFSGMLHISFQLA